MAYDDRRGIARIYLTDLNPDQRRALWMCLITDLKHPALTGGLISLQFDKGPNIEHHISRGETLSGTAYTLIQ